MKAKYTPGTPDGLVGKTHTVEIVRLKWTNTKYIKLPMIKEVLIKYEDGKTEWVDGDKFLNNTANTKILDYIR